MPQTEARGYLLVSISEDKMRAAAEFHAAPGGPDLADERSLRDKIKDLKIVYGLDEKSIAAFLAKPATPGGYVIASGSGPVPPAASSLEWTDYPVPEARNEEAEELFNSLSAPALFVEEAADGKKDKKKRTLAVIDTAIIEKGFVKQGESLALIKDGAPGKAGKTVLGTDIQEPKAVRSFYPGFGVVQKGDKLVASIEGFYRRGKNWIQIIPARSLFWSLSWSRDFATCYLDFLPKSAGTQNITASDIVAAALSEGYSADRILDEGKIRAAISEACSSGKPLKQFVLSKDVPASHQIIVSEDGMKATLNIVKGSGNGTHLDLKRIGQEILEKKFRTMNQDKVKNDIPDFYRSRNLELSDYVLAEGKPAVAPGPKTIEIQVPLIDEKNLRLFLDDLKSWGDKLSGMFPSLLEFPLDDVHGWAKVEKGATLAQIREGRKGVEGQTVFGARLPIPAAKEPEIKLFENVQKTGAQIKSLDNGIAGWKQEGSKLFLRLWPYDEMDLQITVSADGMEAVANLLPASGAGKRLSREDIDKIISEQGILHGVDGGALEELYRSAESNTALPGFVIARGTAPLGADESRIEFLVRMASGKAVSLKQNGTADYRNQDRMTMVTKGLLLAKVIPSSSEAAEGKDVRGNTMAADKSTSSAITYGKNIEEKKLSDGSIELRALMDGQLTWENRKLDIISALAIKGDVGPKTGNIKFPGPIRIAGAVSPGFYVVSSSDILIEQNVEGALVSSDQSIVINQGVKGAGKAVLKAKKNISAAFLEQATVLAVSDISIKNAILGCRLKTNGKLTMGTEKGRLIGGRTQARYGIDALYIGSANQMHTEISFGQNYLVGDQIELEVREIQKAQLLLASIENKMRDAERSLDKVTLEKNRQEKVFLLKALEKRNKNLFLLREKFEEHFEAQVIVRNTIYPGVILESHGRTLEIRKETRNVIFIFDQQKARIIEKPLNPK
jgi:uncharacterized protein (DUF342 family)